MNLARHITNRPVYAIRARGFDGEPHFTSLNELITTYHEVIKIRQPEGPYAIAGYAYGAIPIFEITKRMESHGDEVKFLGVFDQQPFSKDWVRMYNWYRVVLLLVLVHRSHTRQEGSGHWHHPLTGGDSEGFQGYSGGDIRSGYLPLPS